jgi:hypothetical protein
VAPLKLLIQTTIPTVDDDWNAGRFSLLRDHLASLRGPDGAPLYAVSARDRSPDGDDPVLSTLGDSEFDELWLFAVDLGNGLTDADAAGIKAFRRRGGGLLAARDHQDLGLCLERLGTIGAVNFFHSRHQEAEERRTRDDTFTVTIDFPNYNSGANGDYQQVTPAEPVHELLRSEKAAGGIIRHFPAHPHEGAVNCTALPFARSIASGRSVVTGRSFDLAVAIDGEVDTDGTPLGRAVSASTFHHFVDYNWDIGKGCPSFLSEPPGDGIARNPELLDVYKDYPANLARWLAPNRR